jgi:hypothetical protein
MIFYLFLPQAEVARFPWFQEIEGVAGRDIERGIGRGMRGGQRTLADDLARGKEEDDQVLEEPGQEMARREETEREERGREGERNARSKPRGGEEELGELRGGGERGYPDTVLVSHNSHRIAIVH